MLKNIIMSLAVVALIAIGSCFIAVNSVRADNLNPVGMTYEGLVSPVDAYNVNVYKPAKYVPANGGYIIWSKAVDPDRQPTYIAVFVFMGRPIVITYYFDKKFYQVSLPHNNATHLEMVEKSDRQIQTYQTDFTNIFRVPFPVE